MKDMISYANGLITKCGDTEHEQLTIGYVYVTPNPPIKGHQFTVGFQAFLSQNIAPGAKIDLTLKYGSVQLYKAALDFCETIMLVNRACPLQDGVVTFEESFVIPLEVHSMTKTTMNETKELATNVQTEITTNNDMLNVLKAKNEEMQNTFNQIDQLENIVNRVKDTYNSVANNLDQMERAISASTSNISFGLGKKSSNATVQPYFPPPGHVNIYNTDELFESISSSK
ncbi:hypothetical protein G6F21_002641 [Rhizopus arrhizus]|nr:hypothetical protein G6F21_002641 [Rhizopus arrhizus]KAG0902969.1 hypothetical protein G6F34_001547 [Rhizopus arrhizus]